MTAWDGHLAPPGVIKCSKCNAVLNPNGHRPAETYMGCYTSLCYTCQNGGPYKLSDEPLESGAFDWSHPPCCPSHRRDRRNFIGFEDCKVCKGKGKLWESSRYGSYTVQCETCSKRHYGHPVIKAQMEHDEKLHEAVRYWADRMQTEYAKRLKAAGIENEEAGDRPIADSVFADGPERPTGVDRPEFPKGWPKSTKRKRRKRK